MLEQLPLGHVVDGPAHERADHEGVEEAAVVGGQQQRAAARQVLAADALHAEVDEEERHEDRPERPVENGVHAAVEGALAKARKARAVVRLPGWPWPLHTLRYTTRDRAVTVAQHPAVRRAGVAQLVERLSCKQGVRGSSPLSGPRCVASEP